MMKTLSKAAVILLLSAPMLPVYAGGYIGIDRSNVTIEDQLIDEIEPSGLRVRLGMRISEFFDIEAQLGRVDELNVAQVDKFEAVYAGAYLKGYLPLGAQSALFGLAGVSGVEFTQTTNVQEFSEEQNGFSYGFGLETQLTHNLDMSADYMLYKSEEGLYPDVSAINFGIKWYF